MNYLIRQIIAAGDTVPKACPDWRLSFRRGTVDGIDADMRSEHPAAHPFRLRHGQKSATAPMGCAPSVGNGPGHTKKHQNYAALRR